MPSVFPTDKQVSELLDEDKVITANLFWSPAGRRAARLEATVLARASGTILKIVAYSGPTNANARHINRDRQRYDGLHKHRYSELDGVAGDAYRPDDIRDPTNIDQSFFDFLEECKITLEGAYQPRLVS